MSKIKRKIDFKKILLSPFLYILILLAANLILLLIISARIGHDTRTVSQDKTIKKIKSIPSLPTGLFSAIYRGSSRYPDSGEVADEIIGRIDCASDCLSKDDLSDIYSECNAGCSDACGY